ncbi:helix-turn-helix domain-containing protein [Paenibacillus pinisoli]|uniref:Helix-turn-helix domain-containing protein n=1 Tax=Paenibacillus pinisoli TaxID=1276110 RepID=A0A3A6PHZ3_9BACL|nr:AraC family transcriptional regulator [Paenibacillus pinisoli]RJX39910.1 helix-turn-helix domain-containing protein [Paenibacillus pinisoli]
MVHRVYVWTDIALIREGEHRCSDSPALLLPVAGKASWRLNGQAPDMMDADMYILPTHTIASFENASGESWSAFLVSFKSVAVIESGNQRENDRVAADVVQELYTPSISRMIGFAEQLFEGRHVTHEPEAYSLHTLFQKMMQVVLEALNSSNQSLEYGAIEAVKRSIAYMDQTMAEPIDFAKQAEQCRLSLRHYSRLFTKLTGLSPTNYRIRSRVAEAKKLLTLTSESVQQVAAKSGFSDPFHFSRTFKRHVGVSPRLYVHLHREHSRIAVYQYLGELLALGVKPVGAPKLLLSGKYVRPLVDGIAETGSTVVMPDMERLKGVAPDAIFTFDGFHYDQYSRIAPTLNIEWSQPAFSRFKQVASLTGRERQADEWMERYADQVQEVRRQLRKSLGTEPTVSFWYIREFPNQFDVYYDREMMYDDLGLNPPPTIDQARRERLQLPFKESKNIAEMPLYAGDYMFVVVDSQARELFEQYRKGAIWRNLQAVKSGRVHVLTRDWLYVDPISRLGQMKELPQLIRA